MSYRRKIDEYFMLLCSAFILSLTMLCTVRFSLCLQALSALAGLLEEDSSAVSDTKLLDNAWRGAEAYHFYLLAQKQLHMSQIDRAFVTSQALTLYEDIMNPRMIHSLIG